MLEVAKLTMVWPCCTRMSCCAMTPAGPFHENRSAIASQPEIWLRVRSSMSSPSTCLARRTSCRSAYDSRSRTGGARRSLVITMFGAIAEDAAGAENVTSDLSFQSEGVSKETSWSS